MTAESRTLLVAHGDEARAKQLADACRERGLACSIALDGSAALEHALQHSPDAILLQLELPVIDGPTLCRILESNPRMTRSELLLIGRRGGVATTAAGSRRVFDERDTEAIAQRVGASSARLAASAASPEPRERGVEGELAQLPLLELLELFHGSRRTGQLEIGGAAGSGRIALRGGELAQALTGRVDGEKALFRMLAWERGHFSFKPAAVPVGLRLSQPTHSLLREGRRQLEEWKRSGSALPAASARLRLRVPRAALPRAVHPIARDLLTLLGHFDRVQELLDRCGHPDYQILRTLQTLIDRGLVELHSQAPLGEAPGASGFLSDRQVARLEEEMRGSRPRGVPLGDARLLVLSEQELAAVRLSQLLARVPGATLPPSPPGPDQLARLAHLRIGADLGIELLRVPTAARHAALWPLAAHGSLGALVPLVSPVRETLSALAAALGALAALRLRPFYAALADAAERERAAQLTQQLLPRDDGPVFLVPHDHPERGVTLLRELFARVLE